MAESALKVRLRQDLNAARKARDRPRTLLLTTLLSDVRNREIELGHELADDEVVDVLRRAVKRRRESAELMKSRPELAERELWEAATLEAYLPKELADDEIRSLVRSLIAEGHDDLGALMKRVMPQVKGRADGSRVNAIAREELAQAGRGRAGGDES
jgi:uncharacterized protein YqeY